MIALLAVLAIVRQDAPPAWRLRLGDEWQYGLKQTFTPVDGGPEDFQSFTYRGTVRVTGLKSDEIDFEIRQSLAEQIFGGEKLPVPDPGKATPATQSFYRTGIRHFEADRYADEAEFRLSRLLWFVFPVAEQSSQRWMGRIPAVRVDWGKEADVAYEQTGATTRFDRKCRLYRVVFREKGDAKDRLAATGTMEIDDATGVLMAAKLSSARAPLPGGDLPQKMALEYEVAAVKWRPRA